MSKQEFGDWQTPDELAALALAVVRRRLTKAPATIVEPTCGEGSFLAAAAAQFKAAELLGYELKESYATTARRRVPKARIAVADFFAVEWERELGALKEPLLVTGNPPWVTNAILGSLGSKNLPEKKNFKGLSGYEALTGKSNFDVSEWMILRLLAALHGRRSTLAVLCKTAVARKVIEFTSSKGWDVHPGGLWRIDAMHHFRAAVDAVLFICETGVAREADEWPVYASLDATKPESAMTVVDGSIVANARGVARTAHLAGTSDPEWRSGLKHDCARVMELEAVEGGHWLNGLGERVDVEPETLFPLLKSSDVANGATARKSVIVTQRTLGEDTSALRKRAPKAWRYLNDHRELLEGRKSSIYRGQPDFAIFGVGPYSFAPWKVAISGLYKRCQFSLIEPQDGRAVMLDDTCYFLPFETEAKARRVFEALRSPVAFEFFTARIFWDAKRPISKAILQRLDLKALLADLKGGKPGKAKQQALAF